MRMYDIIKNKRDGKELSDDEINFFVNGYTRGQIPDEQVSALLMAIFFMGMNERETATLTLSIAKSGDMVDLSPINGFKADKHSTGGVGDKTTLIVAPIVASAGVKVAKMSGRGLGHTGGTIDKLESIKGFKTTICIEDFFDIVKNVGCCVIGQSGDLAPADKKLYALRDVTATVDKMPLIASSIMGKKLASGADGIVLDVKVGSGAFNKTMDEGVSLAKEMVKIGNSCGRKTRAVISNMDKPLGYAIGNALEVIEAIDVLKGNGDSELVELCIELSSSMLNIAGLGDIEKCRLIAKEQLSSGKAFETFKQMVQAQGGDVSYLDNISKFIVGPKKFEVRADKTGYIERVDAEKYGVACMYLGAGRNKKEDDIDHGAGIVLNKKTGDYVNCGDVICTLYAKDDNGFNDAKNEILNATIIGKNKPQYIPIILGHIE